MIDNRTGAPLSLKDSYSNFSVVVTQGNQKIILPDVPFLLYSNSISQPPDPAEKTGKIRVRQAEISLIEIKFSEELRGITSITGIPRNSLMFIAEQSGRIFSVDTALVKSPPETPLIINKICDFSDSTVSLDPDYDERGLLDIVTLEDGRWFIFLSLRPPVPSTLDHINCVYEIDVRGESNIVTLIECKQKIHNGGRLLVAPPYLYVGTGDGGPDEDPEGNAQNLNSLHGKILRFEISTPKKPKPQETNPFGPEPIPPGPTPIKIAPGRPEIFAYGIRNCGGLTMDPNLRIFCANVGHRTVERIDLIGKGGNFGWNHWEGTLPTPWVKVPRVAQIPPVIELRHSEAKDPRVCAVVGGYYVTDKSGRSGYLFADLGGRIYFYIETSSGWQRLWSADVPGRIRVLGRDGIGQIYVVMCESLSHKAKSFVYQVQGI